MAMNERPILFTPANAQLVHDSKKTQTRRIMKNEDYYSCLTGDCPHEDRKDCATDLAQQCPFGVVGDRLWVREAFTYWEDPGYEWKPTRKEPRFEYLSKRRQAEIISRSETCGWDYLVYKGGGEKRCLSEWKYPHPIYEHCVGRFGKTVSAIHMPRWACRTVLEITEVRVQRLQDIAETDCEAELGIEPYSLGNDACQRFKALWESINGPYSWDSNPLVWAITFRRRLAE